MQSKSIKKRALSMLVLVTLVWGSGFIATEYAIQSGMHTAYILAFRFLVGALVLLFPFLQKKNTLTQKAWIRGIGAGVILFCAFYAQTLGQSATKVSNAAFITATNVVIIPFLLWVFTKKRPPMYVFLLCFMTMVGILFLTMDFREGLSFTLGDLIVLLGAGLFALHIVYLGLVCKNEDAIHIAFLQLATAGVLGFVVIRIMHPPLSMESFKAGWLSVLYLGLFSTGICFLLQTWAQKYVHASEAGVILCMEGVFGTIFALLLGMEKFKLNMLLGGFLITVSVVLMDRLSEKKRKTMEENNQ